LLNNHRSSRNYTIAVANSRLPTIGRSVGAQMPATGGQVNQIERAAAGDREALQQLLWNHYDRLLSHIARKLDGDLLRLVGIDDIVQETFIQAIRDIRNCQARSDESFAAWLNAIADHRLNDTIKGLYRRKRGGDSRRVQTPAGTSADAMVELVELISDRRSTPYRLLARREAVQAMQVGIAALPDDQRDAIRLRYLEGKSIAETAAALGRTEAAVNGLIRRAKESLRSALESASLWLTQK
jgi:RNA polymerase sigma-70 factor (ECF subfamily)